LEQSLMEFPGALVLVTHDRYLLDRVSKQILALDGQGNADFFADLGQWEDYREEQRSKGKNNSKPAEAPKPSAPAKPKENLTSKEQKELKEIDGKIQASETAIKAAKVKLEDPTIATNISKLLENQKLMDAEKAKLDSLMERWEELEAKKNQA